jgi:hypothetical protein
LAHVELWKEGLVLLLQGREDVTDFIGGVGSDAAERGEFTRWFPYFSTKSGEMMP